MTERERDVGVEAAERVEYLNRKYHPYEKTF
jgi:hypothetical protein